MVEREEQYGNSLYIDVYKRQLPSLLTLPSNFLLDREVTLVPD